MLFRSDSFCGLCVPSILGAESEGIWSRTLADNPAPSTPDVCMCNVLLKWVKELNPDVAESWEDIASKFGEPSVIRDEKGKVHKLTMLKLLVLNKLEGRLKYNTMSCEIELDGGVFDANMAEQ